MSENVTKLYRKKGAPDPHLGWRGIGRNFRGMSAWGAAKKTGSFFVDQAALAIELQNLEAIECTLPGAYAQKP